MIGNRFSHLSQRLLPVIATIPFCTRCPHYSYISGRLHTEEFHNLQLPFARFTRNSCCEKLNSFNGSLNVQQSRGFSFETLSKKSFTCEGLSQNMSNMYSESIAWTSSAVTRGHAPHQASLLDNVFPCSFWHNNSKTGVLPPSPRPRDQSFQCMYPG
jgi:hypothetical protein